MKRLGNLRNFLTRQEMKETHGGDFSGDAKVLIPIPIVIMEVIGLRIATSAIRSVQFVEAVKKCAYHSK